MAPCSVRGRNGVIDRNLLFAGPLVLSAPHCVRGNLVVFYAVPFDYPLLELSNFLEPFDRLARAQVLS